MHKICNDYLLPLFSTFKFIHRSLPSMLLNIQIWQNVFLCMIGFIFCGKIKETSRSHIQQGDMIWE
ncbi:hypothetical protein HMPREF0083_04305 [Aneurinibacillus aneurinilyticus ATCC 12856]|uniref:Uncharacterized protein n=1 Tax=Aneurinibacillus aneurinilyticus ATCC 12856 TaxID=649747 RepID=U1Y9Z0_ANEAE|nr:hypothetical protein HMPREF0083_04305 [Aneurinibacillus aneurinilyticus ATCC 12856]